jgi:hypothetical protein
MHPRLPTRGGPPSWELDEALITPRLKANYYEMLHRHVGPCEHGNEIYTI